MKRLVGFGGLLLLLAGPLVAAVLADEPAAKSGEIRVVARSFPLAGPVEGLEREVLDFRYAPERWQACIGLPDDPHKTIVGSDGGLYYDYGQSGPEPYDNGQGRFGTCLRARLQTEASPGARQQRLLDARIPVVITEQTYGPLTLMQRAWAGAPRGSTVEQWGPRRVDFLWLTVRNTGASPATGKLVLHAGTTSGLRLNKTGTALIRGRLKREPLCWFSRPCAPLAGTVATGGTSRAGRQTPQLEAVTAVAVQKNWAKPKPACDPRFRHVLIGWHHPIEFLVAAEPGRRYRIVFGLIEGWHSQPGRRPLELRAEGAAARKVDLVGEFGRNVPVAIGLPAEDRDGDGLIRFGVWPAHGAPDRNTILSALWIFPEDGVPEQKELLAGRADRRALACIDADHAPARPKPIEVAWDLGRLAPADEFDVLVAIPQGDRARLAQPAFNADDELQKAIDFWKHADLPFGRFALPDPAMQALLDSCIRNIYQAREIKEGRPAFQVGPTCYRGTWAADGPFILEAVTYLGRADEARAGLEQQVDRDSGPGGVEFSKKSGLRLWMIRRHAQLTGDRQWLRKMWPRVVREVNQIIEYRNMTRTDPKQANYGLMPIGYGDGGLGGRHREYTNVYWTLAGLKAAIEMAEELGEPVQRDWTGEYRDYWQTFDRARNRDKLTDTVGNVYVPVTMKGEEPQLPQRGAWAFLQSIFPGRIFAADDPLMLGTLAMLDANQREGLIYGTGWLPDGIWNYAGSFYAHAHLWLGHGRKSAATLYAFANHACPLLCWREEQSPKGEPPKYVGDMPHNWASAEFIRLVRHSLVLERGRELHLLEG
ncbi:MAG: hypothetical protein GXP27_08470, partial [Planctomycetes bacterium]|nr:hypothetical protein [Planctomycetota bacterium]